MNIHKVWVEINQVKPPGILFDFIRKSPEGAVDSRKSKQMFEMAIFSLLVQP